MMRTANLPGRRTRPADQRQPAPATPLAAMPWWCAPSGITIGFLIPTICLIAMASEMESSMLTVRGIRFLDLQATLLAMLMLAPIALGGWIGAQVQLGQPGTQSIDVRAWDRTAALMGVIALLGYTFLFKELLLNPVLLFQTATGVAKPTRQELGATAGVSSLVNMAQVFFAIGAFRLVDASGVPVPPWMRRLLVVLALLTLFRVYVYSERLAMMEMLVPFGLAMGRWMSVQRSTRWSVVRSLGPYAALPFVILYFGAAEYGRSWSSPTYQGKTSFWEFAIGRFISYYVTSLNNGAGVVAVTPEATWKFEHVLEWVHRAPLGIGAAFSEYVGFSAEAKTSFLWFLRMYADVEFNSNSGIFVPVADLGLHTALVYMLVIGGIGGLCFRAYRAARLAGVLFFPLFFITLLEIFRYPFLGQPRAFTWTLGILLALLCASLLRTRHPVSARTAPENTSSRSAMSPMTAAGAGTPRNATQEP